MAADVTGNPWTIASADAGVTLIWPGVVHILNVEMQGYNGDIDTCILKDANNRVIWQGDGGADKQTVRSGHIGNVIGVRVSTLTSGFIRVYIK